MKSPLKFLISVLALGLLAAAPLVRAADAQAPAPEGQRGGGRGGRGGGRGGLTVEAIETAVGKLTDEQKAKITPIIEKAQKARQDMMAGGGQPDVAKMQEMNTAMRKDIRAVLTEEQAKKFDEMPQGGRGGRQGGGGGGRKKGN